MVSGEVKAVDVKTQSVVKSPAKIAIVLLLGALIIGAFLLRRAGYIEPEAVIAFMEEHRTLAPIVYLLIYAALPSMLMTTLPMTVGAGFLWGPVWGSVMSLTGAMMGHSISFLVSRYVAGEYFKSKFEFSAVKWVMSHVDRHGWKVVAFTRINPIFPATVVSYLFGVTSIKFRDYVWASAVFFIPPTVAITSFGSSLGEFVLTGNMKGIVTGLIIASAALLVMFAMKPLAKKLLPEKEKTE